LSIGAFKALEPDTGKGIISVTWSFCSSGQRKEDEPDTSTDIPDQNGFTPFVIAFIVIGALLLATIIGVAVVYYVSRRRNEIETV